MSMIANNSNYFFQEIHD